MGIIDTKFDVSILSTRSSDVGIIERQSYKDCNSLDELGKQFREAISRSEEEVRNAISSGKSSRESFSRTTEEMKDAVDRVLARNPNDNGAGSTDEIADELDLSKEGETQEDSSRAVKDRTGSIVAAGKMFTEGDANLRAISELSSYAGNDLGSVASVINRFVDSFVFYATYMDIQTSILDDGCGGQTTEVVTTERVAGRNVSISVAASNVGVSEDEIMIRVFWIGDDVQRTSSSLRRLRSFGIMGGDLEAVLSLQETDRVRSYHINVQLFDDVEAHVTNDQFKSLTRMAPERININPGVLDIRNAVADLSRSGKSSANDGSSGNRSGAALASNSVSISDCFDVDRRAREAEVEASSDNEDDAEEDDVIDDEHKQACRVLRDAIREGIKAIERVTEFFQQEIGSDLLDFESTVGLTQKGFDFSVCSAKFNVGAPGSLADIQNARSLLTDMQLGLSEMIQANLEVPLALERVRCLPEKLALSIRAGNCELESPDLELCPQEVESLLDLLDHISFTSRIITQTAFSALGSLNLVLDPMSATLDDLQLDAPCQSEVNQLAAPIFRVLRTPITF